MNVPIHFGNILLTGMSKKNVITHMNLLCLLGIENNCIDKLMMYINPKGKSHTLPFQIAKAVQFCLAAHGNHLATSSSARRTRTLDALPDPLLRCRALMQISSRRRTGECTLVLWFTMFLFWLDADTDMGHAIDWSFKVFLIVLIFSYGIFNICVYRLFLGQYLL